MALATLSVDLVAKLASFEADLGKAARAADKTAAQISSAFGIIKTAAGGLVAGIGVGGLVAFTRSVADSLDALNDVSDATGASIENISALEDVAKRTGTTVDTVTTSLVKFNGVLKDAKPGSDAAAALEALGLSAGELRRLDPAEALRQTAVALAGFADDGNKARLVQELFGKSLQQVAPFLKDLAEQGSLVAKVTAEQAAEADKFNKQLFAMQANLQDLSRSLVGPVITGMNGLIDKFKEGTKAGDGFLVTLLKQTEIARFLNLNGAGKGFAGAGRGSGLAALTGSAEIGGGYDRSAARLLRQGKLSVEFEGGSNAKARAAAKERTEGIAAVTTELDRYLASLEQTIERNQELTAVQTAQLRISEAGAQGFSEVQRQRILALATEIDKQAELKKAIEAANAAQEDRMRIGRQLAIEQGEAVDAANAQYRERLQRLQAGTESQVFRQQQEDVEFLQKALQSADITVEQYSESIRKLFGINEDRLERSRSLAEELGLTFSSAFEDAIVGGKGFSDVLKGLEQDILRMVTRKFVTKPLADAIGGMFEGGGSGGGGGAVGGFLGGIFGKLFSADGGGFTGNAPRTGGLDGKGGFLGMLHPQETVIDHTRGQRAGSTNQYITINPPAGMSRQASNQFAADVARQMRIADARNN